MGKHTAADDETVHPLVAAALSRRSGAAAGAHGEHSGGSTGWPLPERKGGGAVGWPGDLDAAPEAHPQEPAADPVLAPAGRTTPVPARRGWRRLFGARPAA
ncbi:hypothetical protein DQ239_04165 [Blastococcus sp. TF02-09]|uniref:hypothetical protein n=1 Tax=Blastococcus sp. TF02-09 TaxID=2250576 RepID=UPI000DEB1037|nr:hypothetical protein [Blastococcus sp. TF02-9]RBY80269.1 hypothetical protein DQ239_04165 [Blastococcus sp. TF02-9]